MSVRHIQGPQTCPTCGKVSPNRKALTKHLEIHIADTKDQFKCIVCGKGFRHSTKLKVKLNMKISIYNSAMIILLKIF